MTQNFKLENIQSIHSLKPTKLNTSKQHIVKFTDIANYIFYDFFILLFMTFFILQSEMYIIYTIMLHLYEIHGYHGPFSSRPLHDILQLGV